MDSDSLLRECGNVHIKQSSYYCTIPIVILCEFNFLFEYFYFYFELKKTPELTYLLTYSMVQSPS